MVKVLYISGWGRSGSTLLDLMLDGMPGFFAAGELRYFWERGLLEGRLCGCGLPFAECEVWQRILAQLYPQPDIEEMAALSRATRTRHLPLLLWPPMRTTLESRFTHYRSTLARLYQALADVMEAEVIVDSSKFPTYGYLLHTIESLDVYFLHLTRDPRAVAHSWARAKVQPDTPTATEMATYSPVRSALYWNAFNAAVHLLGRRFPERYERVRYEDLVTSPRDTIDKIITFLELPRTLLEDFDERRISAGQNHGVSGNPLRFRPGPVEIRRDEAWRRDMSIGDKRKVTALTFPLLLGYGYHR